MSFIDFLTGHWQLIRESPAPFIVYTLALLTAGFSAGKLMYGAAANSAKERVDVAKERLEAARDDLARFEKRKAEDGQEMTFLKVELAALKESFNKQPRIFVGEGPPDTSTGKDGDIYFQIDENRPLAKTPAAQLSHQEDTGTANKTIESSAANRVPSASLFLHSPLTTMREAMDAATSSNKPVFLIVYDPTHPTQSKLAYSLGYFLEYMTTRKLVDQHFVTALVPNTDDEASKLIPADDPLENSRWIVLSPSGKVLLSEGVYANADEGLKRTRAAIAVSETS